MNRPPFPSSPPSQPSPYRYLGGGGGERPVRVQLIIALVAGLIIVAVPLYLWRRPQPEPIPEADAATTEPQVPLLSPALPKIDFDAALPQIELSSFDTLRCVKSGPGRTRAKNCDHVMFFEDGLSRAIRKNMQCAPSSKSEYTVSYVMEVDFRKKSLKLYSGKSSTMRKSKLKGLIECVERAMPEPDWGRIPHQHYRYVVNVKATYPPNDTF